MELSFFSALAGLVGGILTTYFTTKSRLRASMEEVADQAATAKEMRIKEALTLQETNYNRELNTQNLKIQALELKVLHLTETTVKKEDIAELKSDVKNLMKRIDEVLSYLQAHAKE